MDKSVEKKYILGIDPGIGRFGWAVCLVDKVEITYVDGGCIITKPKSPDKNRLYIIFTELEQVLKKYVIVGIGIEKVFFSKNVKSAISTGESKAIPLILAGKYKCSVWELSPNEIKNTVTGYGFASKDQVKQMIKKILSLDFDPTPDDFADAIAVAYCSCREYQYEIKFDMSKPN